MNVVHLDGEAHQILTAIWRRGIDDTLQIVVPCCHVDWSVSW